ncbi:MAG: ribulose-phosphate 3-epimerase [Actinobacteria bacterium HGW-Actinobacteria-4]|nr:MAG: ribulose-phosphate 3-epimerase [Actinobacteria bacterium HGW-Actinobacteria-4]
MGIQIAPSILSADFANLERDIIAASNADWLHVDVMDGHFVPNMTLGLPVLERLAQVSPLPVDAHLMITNPELWAPRYAEAGAASVTFHLEACDDPVALARTLRSMHTRASVALKPATPLGAIIEHLHEFDMVLIMTVEPGFGGQAFMPETMPKVRALREAANRTGAQVWIEVDGGISEATVAEVVDAGADVLVAGSAVYGAGNPHASIAALRAQAEGVHHH